MTNDEIFWGAVAELHDRLWLDKLAAGRGGVPVVGREALAAADSNLYREFHAGACGNMDGDLRT